MLLVLCMLGQIQGLPLPAPSSVPQPESASSPAWKECDVKSKKVAYDGRSLSSLQYDAEPPLRTMPWLGDRIGEVGPRFVYDAYPIANIRATGPARAPPVDEAELIAAKETTSRSGSDREEGKASDFKGWILVPLFQIRFLKFGRESHEMLRSSRARGYT